MFIISCSSRSFQILRWSYGGSASVRHPGLDRARRTSWLRRNLHPGHLELELILDVLLGLPLASTTFQHSGVVVVVQREASQFQRTALPRRRHHCIDDFDSCCRDPPPDVDFDRYHHRLVLSVAGPRRQRRLDLGDCRSSCAIGVPSSGALLLVGRRNKTTGEVVAARPFSFLRKPPSSSLLLQPNLHRHTSAPRRAGRSGTFYAGTPSPARRTASPRIDGPPTAVRTSTDPCSNKRHPCRGPTPVAAAPVPGTVKVCCCAPQQVQRRSPRRCRTSRMLCGSTFSLLAQRQCFDTPTPGFDASVS